ncbi:arsenate reductase ArsC [Celerinatantimonas sp. YJH-8]|uniref:arsenate reductase ArsC n=1 Tax=Celerinatantimonas sp. YJH-8 TaxID=3228714 RepID=UPI0038C68E44
MKILYICTHNRCRSILSEAITRQLAGEILEARSAGSQPAGEVHPLSIRYLNEAGINTDHLRSQSWDDFADFHPDVVITVCDSAAKEACPVWFGNALVVHWELQDPSKLTGTESQLAEAFRKTIAVIASRVDELKTIAKLPPQQRPSAFTALGAIVRTN